MLIQSKCDFDGTLVAFQLTLRRYGIDGEDGLRFCPPSTEVEAI